MKFCSTDDGYRLYLRAPFTLDGKIYATNGHIMVRIDAFDGHPYHELPEKEGPRNAPQMFDTHKPKNLTALPNWDRSIADFRNCSSCNGTGRCCEEDHVGSIECDECDGGKVPTWNGAPIGSKMIGTRYLRLMETLPGLMIDLTGEPLECIPFVFDGGVGLVMPMRK
jgi:hypothetical protein